MKYRSIMVTGGAGYVGAVLVPELVKKGCKVTVYDQYIFGEDVFKNLTKNKKLKQVKGDIRDTRKIAGELEGIEAVIHLAGISNDPSFELNPKLSREINFEAGKELFDLCKRRAVDRFIFASSSSVYGVRKEQQVTENVPVTPLTDYSKYKVLCEEYFLKHRGDMTTLVLRPATVCGYSPRMRFDLTVNLLTMQALTEGRIKVFGGEQMRPNIHIKDMVRAYTESLEYESGKINGKIYNAGYRNYSVLDIAQLIKRVITDAEITIERQPSDDRRSYRITSEKIRKELGFCAEKTVEEAISDIQDAYLQGKFGDSLYDNRYYNIKRMKEFKF